jgi:hypothetical protein
MKKLFILGSYKTATSTLVGMLNCHPEIFLLYETQLYNGEISKYGKQFLNKYSNMRYLFRFSESIDTLYDELHQVMIRSGYPYKYIGDKLPYLDTRLMPEFKNSKIIFNIRDIRTWLAKEQVTAIFVNGIDTVPIAIDYCVSFFKSFLFPDVFHCKMEELINSNKKVISDLSRFLDLSLMPYLDEWWDNVVIEDNKNPKSTITWWKSHPSSLKKPTKFDIKINIAEHPFWEAILPLFNKYYKATTPYKFSTKEITKDILEVKHLNTFSPLPPPKNLQICTLGKHCNRRNQTSGI